ncbi:Ras-specific guanine nucleotide-releasing factor RalGPS1, partial [Ophiophagus hannah]
MPRWGPTGGCQFGIHPGVGAVSTESSNFRKPVSISWFSPTGACSCRSGASMGVVTMEGPLRRKTLLKEGRKPTYKSTPGKKVSIVGWMVALPDDPEHPDIFQLNNPDKGNVYKFQTGSRFHAILWHKHLDDACRSNRPQVAHLLLGFRSLCRSISNPKTESKMRRRTKDIVVPLGWWPKL